MLRNVLTDYTRMGRSQLELPIYDCECWAVGKPHMNAPQVIIPFCARVTVGIDANVAAFKVRLRERGARFCRGAVLAVGVKSRADDACVRWCALACVCASAEGDPV